jgi:predicted benzoate:H+ symporter BenE
MFRFIGDFKRPRSVVEAIGFYVFYAVLGVVASGLVGYVASLIDPSIGFQEGLRIGNIVAIVLSLGLSFAIARAKGLLGHAVPLVVIVLSGVGAAIGGVLLGLIFSAFLSTRRSSARAADPSEAPAAA